MTTPQKTTYEYENNPLIVTVTGLKLMFDKAQQVAILIVVLAGVLALFSFVMQAIGTIADEAARSPTSSATSQQAANIEVSLATTDMSVVVPLAVIIFVLLVGIMLISYYVMAITDYTAARVAENKPVTLKEAARVAWQRFGGYLWVIILSHLKILAWSLLLIIPGIYKSFRYSLAGVSYFSDSANLRGDKAIQHSNQLTAGGWLTTFASLTFFNFLTGGIIEPLLTMGSKTVLFRQYTLRANKPKPDAHILSWIGLLLPFVLIILVMIFIVSIAATLAVSGDLSR